VLSRDFMPKKRGPKGPWKKKNQRNEKPASGNTKCIEVGIFYISVEKRGSLLLFFAQVWLIFNFCL
jgi:hypothetical protein